MFQRALFGLLAIAIVPAFAVNIATRSGGFAGQWTAGGVGGQAQYASFTTTSGYSAVTITAPICSFNGSAATGRVILTSGIGGGATLVAGPTSFTTSANCVAAATAPTTVFTGLTLPAGTYYLIIDDQADANFAVVFSNAQAAPAEAETGAATIGGDFFASGYNAGNVPASTWTAIGSPSHGILFSVNGTAGIVTPPSSSVPTLGTFGMIGTGMLLGLAGLLFLKRQPVNPLQ